jgi:hypothetical protein
MWVKVAACTPHKNIGFPLARPMVRIKKALTGSCEKNDNPFSNWQAYF